jgi:hypothetical protein
MFHSGMIQAKLAISQPGDVYEQEADRIADQVVSPVPTRGTQGECAGCSEGAACPKCEEEARIQAKEKPGHAPRVTSGLASQIPCLRGGGQPLPSSVRAFFEPRFGHDFSHVRVHTDGQAAEAARAVNALAYAVGRDIVFGAGQYAPTTGTGRRLLGHELTHVVQQTGGAGTRPGSAGISPRAHPASAIMRDAKGKPPAFPSKGLRIVGPDAKALLGILGGCGGMTLDLDKDNMLMVKAEGDPKAAKSTKARDALKGFVGASSGVIIDTDPKAEAVEVGAFGHEAPGYQKIDVANVRVLAAASGEKKGLGECDAVFHEVAEAIAGRRLSLEGKLTGEKLFLAAHGEGEKLEKDIRKDLGLPERSSAEGDLVKFGREGEKTLLFLDSTIFGTGKDVYTQLNLVRFILGPIKKEGGEEKQSGDYNVIASHVVKGEVRFKTAEEAIKVFNKYASDFGFNPIEVPKKK